MEESPTSSILIVDDSTTNIRVVSNIIADLGHKIHVAKSAVHALNFLTTCKPSLIFMDINMPKMTGFECCKRIKSSASRRNIPIVFISGSNAKQDMMTAKMVGGEEYLTKPVDAEKLKNVVLFHLPETTLS